MYKAMNLQIVLHNTCAQLPKWVSQVLYDLSRMKGDDEGREQNRRCVISIANESMQVVYVNVEAKEPRQRHRYIAAVLHVLAPLCYLYVAVERAVNSSFFPAYIRPPLRTLTRFPLRNYKQVMKKSFSKMKKKKEKQLKMLFYMGQKEEEIYLLG